MNLDVNKLGALGGVIMATLFAYITFMFLVVAPIAGVDVSQINDPTYNLQLSLHKGALSDLIYVPGFFGFLFVIPIAFALHRRLAATAPGWSQFAYALAIISTAMNVLEATNVIVSQPVIASYAADRPDAAVAAQIAAFGYSDGYHAVGYVLLGTWMLIVSGSGLASRAFPRVVAAYGLLPGALGVASLLALDELRPLVFLTAIVWFVMIAIVLWRAHAVAAGPAALPSDVNAAIGHNHSEEGFATNNSTGGAQVAHNRSEERLSDR